MQENETIAAYKRRGGQELRVSLRCFEGRLIAVVRNFYVGQDGTMRPTKARVRFAIAKLGPMIEALRKARDRAEAIGVERSRWQPEAIAPLLVLGTRLVKFRLDAEVYFVDRIGHGAKRCQTGKGDYPDNEGILHGRSPGLVAEKTSNSLHGLVPK